MLKIGEQVRLIIDNSKVGMIMAELPTVNGMKRYRVFHGPSMTDTGDYLENQIELVPQNSNINYLNKTDFIAFYASKKLGMKSRSTIFSLNSGKIKFIPFQFRPLARILKAERPRILIADDVGVGKTIETGILIKEFEKRDNISKIIIICPKELSYKWRTEMRIKFDEKFEILDSERLRYCLNELDAEGVWPSECGKCIVSLEMFRRQENIDLLNKIDVAADFNMLIVDEAHHVSNSDSNSYKIVEYFCECAEINVFLSATPLQLGSHDLFSLLHLLMPDEFENEAVFAMMCEPNRHINAAVRALRNSSDSTSAQNALKELEMVVINEWAEKALSGNSRLNYWLKRLAETENRLSDEERIACLNDLEALNTLSHIINRTRRKDIQAFTVREPHTIKTVYNEAEEAFYKAVVAYKKNIYSMNHKPFVVAMIMSTIERMITSSLPAFAKTFLDSEKSVSLKSIVDEIELEDVDDVELSLLNNSCTAEIRKLASNLPDRDSKSEALIEIVRDTIESEPGKLLVFSFFKNTLRYLLDILKKENIRVSLITGDTSIEEREELRKRFRMPKNMDDAIDVLLCSEVGCEGLDYEFCNRMVNYDIPWNPMKIEQRIGRIDRFGQKSDKVQIFNFITEGTVEEKIFFRCFERLNIFKATIGDMEEILGDMTGKLSKMVFDSGLTDEQKLIKAAQESDNVIRALSEQRKYEENVRDLFLMDAEKKDDNISSNRKLQVTLLKSLIKAFFARKYPRISCTDVVDNDCQLRLKVFKDEKKLLLSELDTLKIAKKIDRNSKELHRLVEFLESDAQTVILNFDSETESFGDILWISDNNPLVKLSLNDLCECDYCFYSSFNAKPGILQNGSYSFACYSWEEKGYRDSCDMKIVVTNDFTKESRILTLEEFEAIIVDADEAENLGAPNCSEQDSFVLCEQEKAKLRLKEINSDIVNSKLASLAASYNKTIAFAEEAANKATNANIRKMRHGEAVRKRTIFENKKKELEAHLNADILVKQIASGTIEVK